MWRYSLIFAIFFLKDTKNGKTYVLKVYFYNYPDRKKDVWIVISTMDLKTKLFWMVLKGRFSIFITDLQLIKST